MMRYDDGTACNPSIKRSTDVELVCDAHVPQLQLQSAVEVAPCTYRIVAATRYACDAEPAAAPASAEGSTASTANAVDCACEAAPWDRLRVLVDHLRAAEEALAAAKVTSPPLRPRTHAEPRSRQRCRRPPLRSCWKGGRPTQTGAGTDWQRPW